MNLPDTVCIGHNDPCKNESHGRKIDRKLFYFTGNGLEHIDIDSVYDDDKIVI